MFEQSGIRGVIINSRISEFFRKKVFCLQKAVKKASNRGGSQLNALLSKLETGPWYRYNIISISISYSLVSFFRRFAFLTRVYVEYSLENHFVFLISLFGLSAIFNGEHAHYVGLVVAYTWNREKQMFVALGKEFDMAFDCGRFRCIIKNEFTFKSDSAEVKKRPDCANNTI